MRKTMVVIRLSRLGAKKRPFYHMVVTDKRNRRDGGNCIDRVGYYNPYARGQEVPLHIDLEKVTHWQSHGAQLSDRVTSLVKQFKKAAAQ
jgi:small subunit ribosomal protein S16